MSETVTGPALSATGTDPLVDMPTPPPASASNDPADRAAGVPAEMDSVGQAAIAESKTGKDQVAQPETKAEAPDKTDEQIAEDALQSKDTPAWMKREVTKARNKERAEAESRTAAEQRAVDAEKRLNDALEALKTREPAKEEPKVEVVEAPRPTRADFETPEAYDAAVDVWATARADAAADRARQKLVDDAETARVEKEKTDAEELAAQTVKALRDTWTTKRDKAIEQYPDYVEVVENDAVRIDVPMAHTAIQAENGTEMLYFLGKNPEEAARIAALPPPNQIFEMGKLSATLASQPKVDVSKAPGPISPLTSPREGALDANREETMDEVAARVSKREASARSPMWGTRH